MSLLLSMAAATAAPWDTASTSPPLSSARSILFTHQKKLQIQRRRVCLWFAYVTATTVDRLRAQCFRHGASRHRKCSPSRVYQKMKTMVRPCRASVLRHMMRRAIHRDRHMGRHMASYLVLNLLLEHGSRCIALQIKRSRAGTWTSAYTGLSAGDAVPTLPIWYIPCRSSSETWLTSYLARWIVRILNSRGCSLRGSCGMTTVFLGSRIWSRIWLGRFTHLFRRRSLFANRFI